MNQRDSNTIHPQPNLAYATAIIAIVALITVVIADVVAGFIVNDYNPIRETISDLAAGQKSWILDYGLQIGAIGIIALTIGLRQWKLDTVRWQTGSLALLVVGITIIVIARRNVYGDNVPTGTPLHIYFVLVLGFMFPVACWAFATGLGRIHSRWKRFSQIVAVVWLVLAPLFFIVPDSWNGAYERGVGILMVSWLVIMAILLHRYRILGGSPENEQ